MKKNLLEKEEIVIVDNPSLRSLLRAGFDWSFTTIFWAFLVYLFFPFFNIFLYLFFGYSFYEEVISQAGYREFLKLLGRIGGATVIVIAVIILWGVYNYYFFGKRNRRAFAPRTDLEKMAEFFHLSKTDAQSFQEGKFIEVSVEGPHSIKSYALVR